MMIILSFITSYTKNELSSQGAVDQLTAVSITVVEIPVTAAPPVQAAGIGVPTHFS